MTHLAAIKGRMEKDIDEVGKIARNIKVKLEKIDRNVMADINLPKSAAYEFTGMMFSAHSPFPACRILIIERRQVVGKAQV